MPVTGGDFVFSVEHPIFTAAGPQEWYYGPDGTPLHFPVDRYFEEGRRTARFLGEDVTKYHRTLTTYLDGLLTGGFQLLRVVEPQPPARMLGQPGMRDELPPPHDAAGLRPEADGVAARKTGAARRPRMKNCWKIMNTQKGRTAP